MKFIQRKHGNSSWNLIWTMCFRNLSQFSGKQIFEFLPNFLSIPQYCIGGGGRDVEPINLVCPEFHYGLVRQPHESQFLSSAWWMRLCRNDWRIRAVEILAVDLTTSSRWAGYLGYLLLLIESPWGVSRSRGKHESPSGCSTAPWSSIKTQQGRPMDRAPGFCPRTFVSLSSQPPNGIDTR